MLKITAYEVLLSWQVFLEYQNYIQNPNDDKVFGLVKI